MFIGALKARSEYLGAPSARRYVLGAQIQTFSRLATLAARFQRAI